MRNLKKILALVLAMVMTFSVMATANAFTDDAQIDDTYAEAVDVLAALEVFEGYEDGSFDPKGDITRAEVAAIIYRVVTGDVDDEQDDLYAGAAKFADAIPTWAAGYVGYCANAGYIKGYEDGTFRPAGKVTGFEALAMILRAVGYDAQNEFTGAEWSLNVAKIAKQLGITDNVKPGLLVGAATREVVAEILFRSILVDQVTYTPAFGYESSYFVPGKASIGEETFELEYKGVQADAWGRPGDQWYANGKKLIFLPYDAVASYNTYVDECDIAKDLGITSSKAIEALYIDGEAYNTYAASTDKNSKIDPKATTSYVGAQGRQTEIYNMGVAGYRIVEINTYLAKVTSVTAEKVDKNDHVTKGYVTLTVYAHDNSFGIITKNTTLKAYGTDLVVGDYALVTISDDSLADGEVATAEYTEAVASATLSAFDANTTTVGEKYNDADKFTLGYTKNVANIGAAYDVFVDQYGNIIGMIPSTTNYLVVEAIRWIHDGTLYGGSAVANVVLADGTEIENVTVAKVGGTIVTNTGDSTGLPSKATVSDYYANNGYYYDHLVSYTVNTDGTYNLTFNKTAKTICTQVKHLDDVTITTGLTTIKNSTNTVVANDKTVFLVKDMVNGKLTYTYTTYVGKNNVPSMTDAEICYLTNDAGYATVVVVTNYKLAGNTFVAYVADEPSFNNNLGMYCFPVYKVGSTEATIVYSEDQTIINANEDGFYKFEVTNGSVVVKAEWVIGTEDYVAGSTNVAWGDYIYDRAYVKALDGNSLQLATNTAGTTAWADFYVDNAQYILVDEYTYPNGFVETTLTAVDASAIAEDQWVVVAYTKVGDVKHAAFVYIITDTDDEAETPAAKVFPNLIDSLIDFTNNETVAYNGNGACYSTVALAVSNIKKLDFDEAEALQLMLKSGENVTAVEYRNFTDTASIVASDINVDIIKTGKINLANPGSYIAVEITVGSTPWYAVFEVVA